MDAAIRTEHPFISASSTQVIPADDSTTYTSEQQSSKPSETEIVAKGTSSGSSIFQGLSHLLHTCLVLGALDAKDKFLNAFTHNENREKDFDDDAGQCLDEEDAWLSEVESVCTEDATSDDFDASDTNEKDESTTENGNEVNEDEAAVQNNTDDEESKELNDQFSLPGSLQAPFASTVHADGSIAEEIPIEAPAQPPLFQPSSATAGRNTQPRFETNSLLSPPSPPLSPSSSITSTEPLEYSDLDARYTIHTLSPSPLPSPSETSPQRGTWVQKAQQVLRGQHRRKSTPLDGIYAPLDMQIKTITAAKRPTIIQGLVRRVSELGDMVVADSKEEVDAEEGVDADPEIGREGVEEEVDVWAWHSAEEDGYYEINEGRSVGAF
ncbi:MAG: hypothetical protein L6R41_006075 [Letrouitia leprolyta]|nr:MAG: hypothetical protein L6R41_006075 [Letrouitia leprolyta]